MTELPNLPKQAEAGEVPALLPSLESGASLSVYDSFDQRVGQPGLHQEDGGSRPPGVAISDAVRSIIEWSEPSSRKIAGEGFGPCKFCCCSLGTYSIRHEAHVCNSCFFGRGPSWRIIETERK